LFLRWPGNSSFFEGIGICYSVSKKKSIVANVPSHFVAAFYGQDLESWGTRFSSNDKKKSGKCPGARSRKQTKARNWILFRTLFLKPAAIISLSFFHADLHTMEALSKGPYGIFQSPVPGHLSHSHGHKICVHPLKTLPELPMAMSCIEVMPEYESDPQAILYIFYLHDGQKSNL
jgi:hypothetical protein